MGIKAKEIYLLIPSRRSRVKPGVLSTRAIDRPISLLNNVDLPTFGRPIIAIVYISSLRESSTF